MISSVYVHLFSNIDISPLLQSSKLFLHSPLQHSLNQSPCRVCTTYLRNQNLITRLHTRLNPLAIFIESTRANGQHFRFVQVLDYALWEENSTSGLGVGLDALHEDAVEEGRDGFDALDGGLSEVLA